MLTYSILMTSCMLTLGLGQVQAAQQESAEFSVINECIHIENNGHTWDLDSPQKIRDFLTDPHGGFAMYNEKGFNLLHWLTIGGQCGGGELCCGIENSEKIILKNTLQTVVQLICKGECCQHYFSTGKELPPQTIQIGQEEIACLSVKELRNLLPVHFALLDPVQNLDTTPQQHRQALAMHDPVVLKKKFAESRSCHQTISQVSLDGGGMSFQSHLHRMLHPKQPGEENYGNRLDSIATKIEEAMLMHPAAAWTSIVPQVNGESFAQAQDAQLFKNLCKTSGLPENFELKSIWQFFTPDNPAHTPPQGLTTRLADGVRHSEHIFQTIPLEPTIEEPEQPIEDAGEQKTEGAKTQQPEPSFGMPPYAWLIPVVVTAGGVSWWASKGNKQATPNNIDLQLLEQNTPQDEQQDQEAEDLASDTLTDEQAACSNASGIMSLLGYSYKAQE